MTGRHGKAAACLGGGIKCGRLARNAVDGNVRVNRGCSPARGAAVFNPENPFSGRGNKKSKGGMRRKLP
ncbi:hypothetical protein A6M21_13165 [Desulfotomaculum copahuensis]|uniref:Uncharacterized protein n=1 Tax=Desulfotomaculum copahuensis TaxID=1838280 RepID=A0A1B7LCR5_9FIRM|nr:hypothetical protein A6M21_13165 [Desulfotomaculum copahuensis]